jgi:hypothetical protein
VVPSGERDTGVRELLKTRHRPLVVGDDGGLHRHEVRVRGVPAAGRGQLRRVLRVLLEGVERVGAVQRGGLRLHRLQGHRLETREVRLTRYEEGAVVDRAAETAQQGRGVGRVTGLLRGPEGARLRELALALLGQRLGDRGPYLGGGRGPGRRDRDAVTDGQLAPQGGDLLAETVDGVQGSSAHGRGSGRGQQQGKRHGAH